MATVSAKVQSRLISEIKKLQAILRSAQAKDINESNTVTISMDMLSWIFGYGKYSEITSDYAIRKTCCDLELNNSIIAIQRVK